MAKFFEIQYFDGQSTRSQNARLHLRPDCWEIQILPTSDGSEHFSPTRFVRWPLDGIHRNETSSQTNTFRFGDFPFQAIECRATDFPQVLMEIYPEAKFLDRHYSWLFAQKWKGVAVLAAVLLAIVGAIYFVALPALAVGLAMQLPRSVEIELGKKLAAGVMNDLEIDTARTQLLQNFSKNIDFKTQYPLQFTVVRSEEINAFAMPGGKIVVFDSLLRKIETPAALAGLLAHEAAHVERRHSLRAMARSLSGYLFVSVLFGDVNGLLSVLVENGNLLHSLGYSRTLEHEADATALATLADNQLDQNGMVSLFGTLQAATDEAAGGNSGAAEKALKFLSTHPLTEDRIEFCKKAAAGQSAPVENAALAADFLKLKAE